MSQNYLTRFFPQTYGTVILQWLVTDLGCNSVHSMNTLNTCHKPLESSSAQQSHSSALDTFLLILCTKEKGRGPAAPHSFKICSSDEHPRIHSNSLNPFFEFCFSGQKFCSFGFNYFYFSYFPFFLKKILFILRVLVQEIVHDRQPSTSKLDPTLHLRFSLFVGMEHFNI